VYTRL